MVVAALVLVGTIDVELNDTGFKLSLALFGVGAGLMMSQLGNVIMSSAPPGKTNEAGGLQGTAQNLGASLGTALIGSVLLTGLLTGFTTRIVENPALSQPVRAEITAATQQGIEIVTTEQANAAAIAAGLSPTEADAVTADYADAQLEALKKSMLAVALLALLSLLFTRRLPGTSRHLALGGATPGVERAAVVGAAGLVVCDRRRRAPVAVRSARAADRNREARAGARDGDRPDLPLA
jgi:hypothetical protein